MKKIRTRNVAKVTGQKNSDFQKATPWAKKEQKKKTLGNSK